MIKLKVLVLIAVFSSSLSQKRFMPNLPVGEYRIVFDKLYPCESIGNLSFHFNIYFSKTNIRTTEVKGNITLLVPFDDSFMLDINFASWSSIGGWIPNSYIYIAKKACSTTKNLGGKLWFYFAKAFNFPTNECPVPVGTYITSGLDQNKLKDHNFPKVYFYGKYKMVIKVKNEEKKVFSCVAVEFNLIRPWETPIL